MNIVRFSMKLLWPTVTLILGLAAGILWNPIGGTLQMRSNGRAVSDVQSQNQKLVAEMKENYGVEMAEFTKQFEDMTIRIKKNPIDAWASPDGRFVIRLFGSDEWMASDLWYPDEGGATNELVRHYSFSCGKQSYSCDFGRNVKNPEATEVHFSVTDSKGGQLVYMDDDGDGHWDRFVDYTQESPKAYVRDGLYWKERAKSSGEDRE